MMPVALVWDNLTRISGVTTWLLQCLDQLPHHGLDPWIFDLGSEQGGEIDCTQWAHRIVHLPCSRRRSEEGWRCAIRREFERRQIRAVVFNEHRFGEDVMWALPEGFPGANVLHADRPDGAYYRIAAALDSYLYESWCVSPSIARKLNEVLPIARRDRVFYLPLGVPLPRDFQPARVEQGLPVHLLYSGRIIQHQKRIRDAAEFCAELDRHGVAFVFHIVGDGPELPQLRQDLRGWLSSGAVVLHGAVPYAEAMRIASLTHILLLFSAYEGLPLSLLEAMARGNLPVETDIESGISDVLQDGLNALVFPVAQPTVAAQRIADIVRDPLRLQHLRSEAVLAVASFDQAACMVQYAERIRGICLPDHEMKNVWQRPRPAAWSARPLRRHLSERLPGWMGGRDA